MKTSWPTMVILMTLTVAAAAGLAHAQDDRSSSVTSREIAGTLLVLRPNFAYQQAVLRVVGPGGYEARQSFEAGSIVALDLLAAGMMPTRELFGREGTIDAPRSLLILPDGHYRYEAVFAGVSGPVIARGHLFVRNGSLHAVPQPEEEATASVEAAADLEPQPRASLTEAEFLRLTDDNNNGLTLVELQANNAAGARLENWQIANSQGDFHIIEDGTGGQNEVSLAILQDVDVGVRVGIGTTAPATLLHLVRPTGGSIQAKLRIESGLSAWDLSVRDGTGFFINQVGSPFLPFRILTGAVSNTLVLDQNGVGVGTPFPEAKLHVNGDTRLDGELSVLSSKAAKEDFVPVDSRSVLARLAELPIQEWSYRGGSGFRHLGPVAEDFHAVFSLGKSERSINPLDLSGVALAAIQGLQTTLADQQARTEQLLAERDREISKMSERLAALEARLQDLAQ